MHEMKVTFSSIKQIAQLMVLMLMTIVCGTIKICNTALNQIFCVKKTFVF